MCGTRNFRQGVRYRSSSDNIFQSSTYYSGFRKQCLIIRKWLTYNLLSDTEYIDIVFVYMQIILIKNCLNQNNTFSKVTEEVQHFPVGGGGGVQLFPEVCVWGGGGGNCLFTIETHITCDFRGGRDPGDPDHLPPLERACASKYSLKKYQQTQNITVWLCNNM